MNDPLELTEVLDLLYGSILDEGDFISPFGCGRGSYFPTFDRVRGKAVSSTSVGVGSAAPNEYLHQYSAHDDVCVAAAREKTAGAPVTERSLVHPDTFQSGGLDRDFLTGHDIPHLLALWTRKSPTHLSALASTDEERLAPLVPHLVRALQVREALQAARAANSAYAQVLDRLPFGVVMLDWARTPIEVSCTAELLFRTSGVIQMKGGRVRAANTNDDNRLQRAICVAMTRERSAESYGTTLTLRDSAGSQTLRVALVSVPRAHPYIERLPACMLLIFDPSSLPAPSIHIVMKSLQLTRAEARLACELCRGVSLREAAKALRLSINTCKTQLKSIYARTGCGSHAELAKALLITGLAQRAALANQSIPECDGAV